MTRLLTLDDLDRAELHGAAVLVRVDFNVPISDGQVMDDTRLTGALPTLAELRKAGARVLLASHRGRPKGERRPELSLAPVAGRLGELLKEPVAFAEDCVGEPARRALGSLAPGGVCLLENLRFHPGEKANDPEFSGRLAELAEIYVDDAFGTAHRGHASVAGVPTRSKRRAAGRLLVHEVETLGTLLGEPERPFAAVVGGAKIGGKADTLLNLLPRLDLLVLGGGMANTFLAARGYEMGRSLVDRDSLEVARRILSRAADEDTRVVLPDDLVVTDSLESPGRIETVAADRIPPELMAVDVGERTRRAIAEALGSARTIFWNGPLGVFEKPPFDEGTLAAAVAVAACGGFTVIGGGETVAAAKGAGVADRLGHVSTGGGAALEFLAGKKLPGITVLEVTE